MNTVSVKKMFLVLLVSLFSLNSFSQDSLQRLSYWSPENPPLVKYTINCKVNFENEEVKGHVSALFCNTTSLPIELLAVDWKGDSDCRIFVNNSPVNVIGETEEKNKYLIQLETPVAPQDTVSLEADFQSPIVSNTNRLELLSFHPKIDWGFQLTVIMK